MHLLRLFIINSMCLATDTPEGGGIHEKNTLKPLLQSSYHPQHTKRAIPFSLALRLRRICSSDETFKQRSNELNSYLNKRGYNLSFLNQEVGRVQNNTRTQALTPKDTTTANQPQRVTLVITYNPALRYVSSIINKSFSILCSSPLCTYHRRS